MPSKDTHNTDISLSIDLGLGFPIPINLPAGRDITDELSGGYWQRLHVQILQMVALN